MVKIGRPKTKKGNQLDLIKKLTKKGYSSKQIQKELSDKGLGIRRKTLLAEIRSVKNSKVSIEKQQKSIPKKYRKKREVQQTRFKQLNEVYRMSLIIRDLPLHSRPFARNYLGFRLTAFSFDANNLINNKRYLKSILIKETNRYTKGNYGLPDIFENFNWSHKISIENPTKIVVNNIKHFDGYWEFRVEKDGIEQYSRDGRF